MSRPGPGHWLGTDQFGRDVLSRVLYGSRASLGAGFGAVTISLGIGVLLGAVAAMNEGLVDGIVMRAMDVLFAFPAILLALALVAVLGAGLSSVILAIGLVYIPVFSRTARAAVLTVKHQDFVEAVRALGLAETTDVPAPRAPERAGAGGRPGHARACRPPSWPRPR